MLGVWLLVFDNEPLAVRFQTANGIYDVDLDKFNKHIGFPLERLPVLELHENGQFLSTEDEIKSGNLIPEFKRPLTTVSKQFIAFFKRTPNPKEVKHYSYKSSAQLQKEQNDLKKKRDELKHSISGLLPQSLVNRYLDYHFENFEGNRNMYKNFNAEQEKAIKEYFRWKSKVFFYNRRGNLQPLTISKTKALKLVDIMGSANDWQYDGTVDTGTMGGDYCALGHALRYAHYARSESLNREVIFGEKCVSDFFDVPKSVIQEIINAQQATQRDVRIMAFLVSDAAMLATYVKGYNEYLWDVLTHFKGRFAELTDGGAGMAHFIAKLHKLNLPLPKSLTGVLWRWNNLRLEELRAQGSPEPEKAPAAPTTPSQPITPTQVTIPSFNNETPLDKVKTLIAETPDYPHKKYVDEIMILFTLGYLTSSNFGVQVAQTAHRNRMVTPKQLPYLEKAIKEGSKAQARAESKDAKVSTSDKRSAAVKPDKPPVAPVKEAPVIEEDLLEDAEVKQKDIIKTEDELPF